MSDSTAQPGNQNEPKLTPKQQRFVDAYVGEAHFNKAKAARMAGYSEKSARKIGLDLYKTPHIRARIDEIVADNTLSAPEVLAELTDVATRGLDEMIEVRRFGEELVAKMDARAKMQALELIGKHHKLFTDTINHTGEVTVPIRTITVIGDEESD